MQETEIPDNSVSEMPAPSVMITSPQFNRVLEQMGDFGETIHNGMKKKATCTTCMCKSMPLIEVTCFDEEAYNKKIMNEFENAPAMETRETATANETSIIEISAAQENNESEVSADNSGNDENALVSNATSHGERNSWVEKNTGGLQPKKTNTLRKYSKGLVVSSPQSPNRTTNQTKIGTNGTETKNQFTGPEELKSSEPQKTPRKPDSRHSYDLASPSARRRRYTVCSFSSENGSSNEPQNNSELNNQETKLGVAAQNVSRSPKLGNRKLSSEISNDRKKPERIDLSFKVDSLANDTQQSHGLRKRSRTYEGKTQNPRQATSSVERSSSEEHFLLGDFRMQHDNRRSSDGSPSPSVGKSLTRETFQTQESKESLGISKSSLSVSDAAVVLSSDDRSPPTRRGSTLPLHGAKSASKDVNEKQSLSQVDVTQRLNLSPPRRRRVHTPKPPQDDKQSHLGVSKSSTRRKSETDLRKLVSEEEEAEKQRQVCLSTPQRGSRGSDTKPGEKKTSLGVSGRVSLRRSETDLRELVSDEERADAKKSSLSCPQRMRKPSSPKPMTIPETFSSTSSPVSPYTERKIYLAAAKPAARLPIRAKVRNDLAASSQIIIDQAEKELDHCSERLPHISIEEVLKSWHTDSKHWNVVSSLVKSSSDCAPKTNIDGVKNCRYIRDGVLRKKKKSH